MAKLVLDVEVKGQEKVTKAEKSTIKSAERMKKAFDRISTSSGFTKLITNTGKAHAAMKKTVAESEKLEKALRGNTWAGFSRVAKNAKALLVLQEDINDELQKQAKLQAKLAKQGKGTPLQNALAKELATMKRQTKELKKQAGEYKKQEKQIKKNVGLMGKLKGGGFGKMVAGGVGAGLGFVGITGLISSVQRLIDLWKRFALAVGESFYTINTEAEQSRILLSTALGSESAGARMFGEVLEMATKMPFSIRAISDSFVKLQTAGIENAAEKVTILADAISAFGGSDEDLRLATIAIQQMAGKGVAAMEELRRQLGERVPTAIRGMAREMGISYLELVDKVSTGTLLFDEATQNALFRGLQDYAGAAEKRMDSMLGAVKLLQTAWQRLMIDIGDGNNAFSSLSRAVRSVADALNTFRESAEGRQLIDDISTAIVNMVDKVTPEAIYAAFKLVESVARFTLKVVELAVNLGLKLLDKLAKAPTVKDLITNPVPHLLGVGYGNDTQNIFGVEVDVSGVTSGLQAIKDELNGFKAGVSQDKDILGIGSAMAGTTAEIDYALGAWEGDFERFMGDLANMDNKAFKNLPGEIAKIDKELNKLTETLEKIDEQFKKVVISNQREELKFAVDFGLEGGVPLKEQIDAIGEEIKGINVNDAKAKERVLELLRKQRDLIREMSTDIDKVTKAEVRAAKARYESYYQQSRGGKAAGTAQELVKRRQEYAKLQVLEKAGLADSREEKQLAQEKLDLLKENTRLTEEMQAKLTEPTRTKIEELAKEAEFKDMLHKENIKNVDDLRNIENLAWQEKAKELEEEFLARKKIYDMAVETANVTGGGTSYEPYDGRYAGGPVTGGTPYIVGEKGPELFVPNNSGQIIPNNQLGGSGDTTEIYLNFSNRRVGPLQSTKQIARDVLKEFEIMQGALS